mmetsp:Transcript_20100/g.41975  ORF Transcript_20100/g.41975 Transcript_20100/m.41975 type:complete len:223 (+) Transcript_20100:2256-2924(+)
MDNVVPELLIKWSAVAHKRTSDRAITHQLLLLLVEACSVFGPSSTLSCQSFDQRRSLLHLLLQIRSSSFGGALVSHVLIKGFLQINHFFATHIQIVFGGFQLFVCCFLSFFGNFYSDQLWFDNFTCAVICFHCTHVSAQAFGCYASFFCFTRIKKVLPVNIDRQELYTFIIHEILATSSKNSYIFQEALSAHQLLRLFEACFEPIVLLFVHCYFCRIDRGKW